MNSTSRTLTFVGVAAVSALIAWGGWSATQPSSVEGFGDIGQEFFSDFDDALAATSLTVVDYDDEVKDVVEFSVSQNEKGLWVIPSHHDYPAEAKERLAKTATSLMGVKKTAIQSRLKDDWKRFGVVDPSAEGIGTAEERGTRLTLADGSGNPLVDLIIGNQSEDRSGHYFVREPENDNTYVTELQVDLSAKFSDWIEPDLLKMSSSDVVKVTLDNYSINEEQGTVEGKEKLEFAKADLQSTEKWQLAGLDTDTEELDDSPITSLVTNLDKLKIVGVRKKPEGMGGNLRLPAQLQQAMQASFDREMSARGFFYGGDESGQKRLYANEGDMIAGLSNGVEYSLYFGEIARGSGKDIEVGLSKEEEAKSEDESEGDAKEEAEQEAEQDGPRRYLFLKAAFNEALLGEKPVAPVEPVKPEILEPAAAEEKAPAVEEPTAKEEPKKEEAEKAPAAEEAKAEEASDALKNEADVEGAAQEEAEEESQTVETTEEPEEVAPEATESEAAATEVKEDAAEATDEAATETAAPEAAAVKEPAADTTEDAKQAEPAADKADGDKPADTTEPAAEPAKPVVPEKDPQQVAQEEYDQALAAYETEKRSYETKLKAFDAKVKTGQEKADELSRRFAAWYYVISSDSFEKFRVTRNDVIKKKEVQEEATDDAAPADAAPE